MSNLESVPSEVVSGTQDPVGAPQLLEPREVPLGGLRAMSVRRTLPQRQRSLIGAWCFVDHYGPDRVSDSGGMRVARHPHTGLATVSWLFTGEVDHLDSAGHSATVRPGELNLMIAGRGISHQEFSTPETTVLHGAQLWFALPDATRHMAPEFHHYAPEAVLGEGTEVRTFIGSLSGSTSPVETHTPPLLGAEVMVEPGARLELELDPSFEHGVLVDSGDLTLDGDPAPVDHLIYLPVGRTSLRLVAGARSVRVLLVGGQPLGEQIVMWWNFIGRSHAEVVAYRAAWQAEIGAEPASASAAVNGDDHTATVRFGPFPQDTPAALPAPALPHGQLRARS